MAFSIFLLLISISFAQMSNISAALASLCDFFVTLLPILSMLVIVAGGAIYAGGQLMGAETRARANVWATSLLMGALIGILISVLGPFVMQTMYGGTWTTACQGSGGGGGQTSNCPAANPQIYCATTCCHYGGTAACCTSGQKCCGSAPNAWCCSQSLSCGTYAYPCGGV